MIFFVFSEILVMAHSIRNFYRQRKKPILFKQTKEKRGEAE
jgi:hypothetical protein